MDRRELRDLCRHWLVDFTTADGVDTVGLAESVATEAALSGWSYRQAFAYCEEYAQVLAEEHEEGVSDGVLSAEGREQALGGVA